MALFQSKIKCIVCGGVKGKKRRFPTVCSLTCYRVLPKEVKPKPIAVTRKCRNCDLEFTTTGGMVYCGRGCSDIYSKNKKVSPKNDYSIFKRDGFRCVYCGKSSIEDGVKLRVDHINPLSINGFTEIDNLITACYKCNAEKSNSLMPDDILERIKLALHERNSRISENELDIIKSEIKQISLGDKGRFRNYLKIG